jgi:hypothetical protein
MGKRTGIVEFFGRYFEVKKVGGKNSKDIELSLEGSSVELSFAKLTEISEYYGTRDINFNKIDITGCPTCGPTYIWEIEVFNITKNYPF